MPKALTIPPKADKKFAFSLKIGYNITDFTIIIPQPRDVSAS